MTLSTTDPKRSRRIPNVPRQPYLKQMLVNIAAQCAIKMSFVTDSGHLGRVPNETEVVERSLAVERLLPESGGGFTPIP